MKAILIDDEPLALDFLERQIKKISNIMVAGKFTTFNSSKESILIKEVDIVFLDIEMPESNGLELAEQLLEINPNLFIIFVTAFKDYAVNAFELCALDYILKPVQLERLQLTVDKIKRSSNNQMNTILPVSLTLQINVCRELTFQFTKDKIQIVHWRTTKAQELFLYLLHNSGKTIHNSTLIEILWHDIDHDKALSKLYNAIYHVRKTLSKYSNHFSIKNVPEGYILLTKNAFIDIVEWETRIVAAPPLSMETVDDYEAIMDLYTGPLLQQYDYWWVENERHRLELLWTSVAYQLGNFYFEHGELKKSRMWFIKICTARPEEENAHFSLMKLFAILGDVKLVEHQYTQLKNALKELDIQVSSNIKEWYDHWIQNQPGN
ncbi:response regulator [Paucisalibacillus sp. EB02]|uniref:response regulator n=1 Tax=Paucisalibacillus sp. EB02 TaxID=1347087 RepID=UPI0004B65C59|nr:response regulator [Paucisalibacillus sp. EB02]